MKRCLITGSAGFVGSHLVDHLIKNTDWEIIGIDSFKHRGDSLRVYQDQSRYKIFTHDLSTPISYRLIDKIGEINYVINMASDSHVDRSILDPVPFCLNNFNIALNVLEYAREVRPDVFIQISTDEVYGAAAKGQYHKEWSTIIPSNPYSASKASQEALAISYWRSYGIPLIITNTMNIIGERQDPEKFLPLLISRIYNNKKVMIHGNRNDIGSRFYIHARNVSDALLYIINNLSPKVYRDNKEEISLPDRYNIVGELELNNLQLAQMVAKIMGKKLKFEFEDFHKTRPGHDRRYALSGEKLCSFGWSPPVKFEESLKKIIDWTSENKEWLK